MQYDVVLYDKDFSPIYNSNGALMVVDQIEPDEVIDFDFQEDVKDEIGRSEKRQKILKAMIDLVDGGIVIGFNFIGTYTKGGKVFYRTKVFYYTGKKEWLKSLGIKHRIR